MIEEVGQDAIEPKRGVEAPHVHIDVHIHLESGALQPTCGAVVGVNPGRAIIHADADGVEGRGRAPARPWRRHVATAAIAAGVAWLAVQIGYRAGNAPPPVVASAAPQAVETLQGPSATAPALARELQQPPRVDPTPGASNGGEVSGPAAFGFHD